ncbi:hypothetical protein AN218_17440 [Streptomyces nanshensis]|uniref:Uncharacterized protein n=1 Tax=Streptomyces nanshensis TaxID=518642 RepID=A0A1E7L2Y5_9ACTN|nr:hypothetical protein AN218_17440 [Streptomyces nanshensis]
MTCFTRTRQRPYDNQATWGQRGQSLADQMPQPTLDAVTHHGTADGLAHDETRTGRGSISPRLVRVR